MLNEIIMRGGHQPIKPLEADPSIAPAFHGKVNIHALPVLLFASGYTHFLQRLPERRGGGIRPICSAWPPVLAEEATPLQFDQCSLTTVIHHDSPDDTRPAVPVAQV